jgi:nucleotide-binding universal stress UspA family protein
MAAQTFKCEKCGRQSELLLLEIEDEPLACPYCGGLDMQLLAEEETEEGGGTMHTASMGPIIVGVDGSSASLAGLERAAALSVALATRLIVVFVRHMPSAVLSVSAVFASGDLACAVNECEEEARRATAETLSRYEFDWRFEVREGEPGRELIEAAKAHHAQAILVGAARHSAVSGTLVSSVSAYLLHHAPQSVAVVRPQPEPWAPANADA